MTKADTRAVDPAWRQTKPVMFWCAGKPEPKGSARAFMPKNAKYPIVTSDNPRSKAWEKAIHVEAKRRMGGMVFTDPVHVMLAFLLPRPKALKGMNVWHTTRPDLDKLVRAVLDGLTGAAYADDGLVVMLLCHKYYANVDRDPGVEVHVCLAPGEVQPQMI